MYLVHNGWVSLSFWLSIPGLSSVEALILPNLFLTLLVSVFHYSKILSSLFMVLSVLTFHSQESWVAALGDLWAAVLLFCAKTAWQHCRFLVDSQFSLNRRVVFRICYTSVLSVGHRKGCLSLVVVLVYCTTSKCKRWVTGSVGMLKIRILTWVFVGFFVI